MNRVKGRCEDMKGSYRLLAPGGSSCMSNNANMTGTCPLYEHSDRGYEIAFYNNGRSGQKTA